MSKNLSIVLATFNEEDNISRCLESVKDIAGEIIIIDGSSTDKTVEIAKKHGAKVIIRENPKIFHINKQIALENATYKWILQLDADESLSKELAREINNLINMSESEIERYQGEILKNKLFRKHMDNIEKRDGKLGKDKGVYCGFFIPRRNYFLGKYLKYGGTYPDGVIRLVRNGKAMFPCKSVHEQIEIDGKVGWLKSDLMHMDSPTFGRYLQRNSKYIDLIKNDLKVSGSKSLTLAFDYLVVKPVHWFFLTTIRHKGILDGWQGVVFSFFSALRFPRAYTRYIIGK